VKRSASVSILSAGILVVLLDEWVKAWAISHLPTDASLANPGAIVLAIHKNFGIAFDIPFKMPLVIVVSVIIGLLLLHIAATNASKKPAVSLSAALIIVGALGNLYDRVAYGFTVDYLLLGGRLAINLCDLIIVLGVGSLLLLGGTPWPKPPLDREDEPAV
jgi:signal peptidase II